jgi:hypothetical protein
MELRNVSHVNWYEVKGIKAHPQTVGSNASDHRQLRTGQPKLIQLNPCAMRVSNIPLVNCGGLALRSSMHAKKWGFSIDDLRNVGYL